MRTDKGEGAEEIRGILYNLSGTINSLVYTRNGVLYARVNYNRRRAKRRQRIINQNQQKSKNHE